MKRGDRVIVQHYLKDGELHDFPGIANEKEFNGSGPRRLVTLDNPKGLPKDLLKYHEIYGGLYYSERQIRLEGKIEISE